MKEKPTIKRIKCHICNDAGYYIDTNDSRKTAYYKCACSKETLQVTIQILYDGYEQEVYSNYGNKTQ